MAKRISGVFERLGDALLGRSDHDIALKRIAEANKSRAEELDLGGLGLTEVPPELTELPWLKRLFLGPDEKARKEYVELKKRKINALTKLPSKLFPPLPNLELLDLSENSCPRFRPRSAP
jgi:Leucine-rich repeat (LRR) protein